MDVLAYMTSSRAVLISRMSDDIIAYAITASIGNAIPIPSTAQTNPLSTARTTVAAAVTAAVNNRCTVERCSHTFTE